MATAKQLAALKKARAARAKNLKAKKPVRKTVAKKNPVKRKVSPKFNVQVKLRGNKIGYLTTEKTLDDDMRNAANLTLTSAEKNATAFFNQYKSSLLWVKVIPAKK